MRAKNARALNGINHQVPVNTGGKGWWAVIYPALTPEHTDPSESKRRAHMETLRLKCMERCRKARI